jgi:ectoine hydroxylase-related dioxygenase (phytanoyl-CoA dioxygenase family)
MTIAQSLAELGVSDDLLTSEEKAQLDRDGFLALPGILSPEQVEQVNARLAALLANEGESAGKEVHQEAGTDRLSDLVNKGEVFTICFTHPKVLAAIAHVLGGDLQLSSLNARAALPGQGLQGLHADWGRAVPPGEYQVCNSIWLLDDFTPENGATRAVPGSHLSGALPQDTMSDPKQTHPNEVLLLGKAGTVVVFNSHTWHGGTLNQTDRPRRALHSYFSRRNQQQQLNQQKYLRPETRNRLSQAVLTVLNVGD